MNRILPSLARKPAAKNGGCSSYIVFAVKGTILWCLCVIVFTAASSAGAQEAVFVVRHAERADSSADSPLSSEGRARAMRLADWLRTAGVTHIYTTDLRRTIETAMPLAALAHLLPQQVAAADTESLAARVLALGPADRPLVVGHSNTVPALLRWLRVRDAVTIADSEYDNIFVVIPREKAPSVLLRFKY
jgi:broad specificity phosphatase PhoE